MIFLKRLLAFFSGSIQCPRCLGKGHVDENDIKRLQRELTWLPGTCAYCDGKRKVNRKILSRVAVLQLHHDLQLDVHQIAEYFLMTVYDISTQEAAYLKEKEALVQYIKNVPGSKHSS